MVKAETNSTLNPFTLTAADITVKLGKKGGTKETYQVSDISFKLDPKATILSSVSHERAGVYWGPPELTVDITAYAAEASNAPLWTILELAHTRDWVAAEIIVESSGNNQEIYLQKISINQGVVTSITPIKLTPDGVQTVDFTISALDWSIVQKTSGQTVEATAVDHDGPKTSSSS